MPYNFRCHVLNTIVVPPCVARFIRVRTPVCFRGATNFVFLFVIVSVMQRVLVPRSVVKSMKGYLFVWVVNADNQPAWLILHDVCEVSAQDPDSTRAIFINMPHFVISTWKTLSSIFR